MTPSSDTVVPWVHRQHALWQDRWLQCVEPGRLARARKRRAPDAPNPLVSFPVATYNRGRILCERTIPSLLAQTHAHIEVIVVGDQVADDTRERVAAIDDPRVRFVDLPRRGPYPESPKSRWFVVGARPRNAGIRLARGSWIYVISDDDVLYPDAVEKLLRFATQGGCESVTAACDWWEDGVLKSWRSDEGLRNLGFPCGGVPAWMYRSDLQFFGWNPHSWKKDWNRPSDYDLLVRMHRCGVRMGYLNEAVALQPFVEGTRTHGNRAFIELAQQGLV